MAQVYHPKKTSTKLLEGAVAGLLGGAVVALLMAIWDGLLYGNWVLTPTAIGWLATGTPSQSTEAFLVGMLIHFLLFALIGLGFVQYLPLFRRFKINPILGGAIYGAVIGLLIFFIFLNAIKPDIIRAIDNKALIVASAAGGAVIGWWLSRPTAETAPKG
ncbi:MAG: hypothetical protein ABIO92_08230 [Chloroflexia bacterium]